MRLRHAMRLQHAMRLRHATSDVDQRHEVCTHERDINDVGMGVQVPRFAKRQLSEVGCRTLLLLALQ